MRVITKLTSPIGAMHHRVSAPAERDLLSHQQARAAVARPSKRERPEELPPDALVPLQRPTVVEVRDLHGQGVIGSKLDDVPATRPSPVGRYQVTRRPGLPRRHDLVSAVDAEATEVLEPVVAVEAASLGPELDDPRPDLFGPGVDRDGPGHLG